MYRYKYIVILLVCVFLSGCADQDTPESTVDELIGVDLSFFVPSPSDVTGLDVASTRMAADVVQLSSTGARELEDVIIIPFKTRGTIGIDDVPSQHLSNSSWQVFSKPKGQFYYNSMCQFVDGVASVLVYGHGASDANQSYYGSTTAIIPPALTPADISFVPTQIRATTEYAEKAEALASYLTAIANTTGWSSTGDSKLKALYLNFIGKKESSAEYHVFAGSSTSILGYVDELYKEVGNYASDATLAAAIRATIASKATVTDAGVTALDESLAGYPANIDLPDGAAAVQWISGEDRFAPQTTTTTIAPITSVTRFAYPAELYYYTNSQISTSNEAVTSATYESEAIWNNVLQNYTGSGVVDRSTRAVAINTPMQYSVARLSTSLNAAPETLTDGDGVPFKYGVNWNDGSFPMTAVIVGGQYPVGYDFKPETYAAEPSESDMRYVYDTQVKTREVAGGTDYYYLSPTPYSGNTNTLVLQSYEGAKVTVVLEFENRSGTKFRGKDCIVYPGSKFYLVGYVDPTVKSGSDDFFRRVFTQDYVTTLAMTVNKNCLANAYSVMPDLLASRMEIGVVMYPKWDVITPANVELF